MNYSKEENRDFALQLLLKWAVEVRADRVSNKILLKIIKLLED